MNGDQQEPPVPLRLPPDTSVIAERVLELRAANPTPVYEGVCVLNEGFHELEAMRAKDAVTAKAKTAVRQLESSGE